MINNGINHQGFPPQIWNSTVSSTGVLSVSPGSEDDNSKGRQSNNAAVTGWRESHSTFYFYPFLPGSSLPVFQEASRPPAPKGVFRATGLWTGRSASVRPVRKMWQKPNNYSPMFNIVKVCSLQKKKQYTSPAAVRLQPKTLRKKSDDSAGYSCDRPERNPKNTEVI